MKWLGKLSPTFVAKQHEKGFYIDRGGYNLTLRVQQTKNGLSKTWTQRLTIDKRVTTVGLGRYPAVTLAEARRRAKQNWRAVEEGRDPRARNMPTVQQAANQVIEGRLGNWRPGSGTRARWERHLQKYVLPKIGGKRVGKVTSADMTACLEPIWHTKPETARKVFYTIRAVMQWAIDNNYRGDDPTVVIPAALGRRLAKTRHMPTLNHSRLGEALMIIKNTRAQWATIAVYEFQILTASRTGEVRGARWEEIDMANATWTVPATRIKSGKRHRVPLSQAALTVLEQARQRTGGVGLIFPSRTGRPISKSTLSKLCKAHNLDGVPHGNRSSFRDWAADAEVPDQFAELALSHTGSTPAATRFYYDLLEQRRPIMEKWAAYLTETTPPNPPSSSTTSINT